MCLKFIVLLPLFFTDHFNHQPDDLFPEIDGWKLKAGKIIYNSDNVWEILREDADFYNSCDFDKLFIAEYTTKNDKSIGIELFSFKNPEGSYGVYVSERNPDFETMDIGTQASLSQEEMKILAGNYYIRLTNEGSVIPDKNEFLEIGKSIIKNLSPVCHWPEPVRFFPQENKMNNTEAYIPGSYLGYNFFNHVFTVRYNLNGPVILFISYLGSAPEASVVLQRYLGIFKEDKIVKEGDFYHVTDLFNGNVLITTKKGYILGVVGFQNKETAIVLLSEACNNTE